MSGFNTSDFEENLGIFDNFTSLLCSSDGLPSDLKDLINKYHDNMKNTTESNTVNHLADKNDNLECIDEENEGSTEVEEDVLYHQCKEIDTSHLDIIFNN